MQRHTRAVFLTVVLSLLSAAAPAWNPAPWLADLAQIRSAVDTSYPNRDWLTGQREVPLDQWFDLAGDRIRQSYSDDDARRALDKLIERFNDGHVALHWPSVVAQSVKNNPNVLLSGPSTVTAFCAARGYDENQVTTGTAASLPGYAEIDGDQPFHTGTVHVDGRVIGVIRIGVFSPQGYPKLCAQAVTDERIAFEKPCDAGCEDRLLTRIYALMTRGLIATAERLRTAGAQLLLIDLSGNGGGTEWVEAAARIVSPVPLRSAPIAVMRGERWVIRWRELAARLRTEAQQATPAERPLLASYAKQASAVADGLMPCSGPKCSRLAQAGFSSGLIAELPAGRFDSKTWAADVFSAAQFPYCDSVWKGPVIVLVDDETWSAAEQFTALLRDNEAAIIMGTRTGGAGCGHLYGNDPIRLHNSGAMLELPNCARFRKDGSNEVGGIVPDVLTGMRSNDGPAYAGRLTAVRLPEAMKAADALFARQRH